MRRLYVPFTLRVTLRALLDPPWADPDQRTVSPIFRRAIAARLEPPLDMRNHPNGIGVNLHGLDDQVLPGLVE
ncbi:hypothetical protein [Streptomyces sp. NPDC048277]|uniref:hypothetical protein n=1 Tax=Streptomyces sp. NPDC048277 TaxID=3155027 RepID=UPI0033F5EA17